MDGVISQAQATLGTLVFQRSTFGGINSKLSNVTSRLPTVQRPFLSLLFFALLFLFLLLCTSLFNTIVKPTAYEHYSVSYKDEKVHGYNHSFTRCGCMHISHIHLLVIQVKFAHFFLVFQ